LIGIEFTSGLTGPGIKIDCELLTGLGCNDCPLFIVPIDMDSLKHRRRLRPTAFFGLLADYSYSQDGHPRVFLLVVITATLVTLSAGVVREHCPNQVERDRSDIQRIYESRSAMLGSYDPYFMQTEFRSDQV